MTVLASRIDRDQMNIDTIERAIVYAAILLRKANISHFQPNNANYNSIRIATDKSSVAIGKLVIGARISYDSQVALSKAGNFLSAITAFSDTNPNPLDVALTTSSSNYTLPSEPINITTLERYFVWLCYLFQIGFYSAGISQIPVSISFLEDAQGGGVLEILITLQYNAVIYAKEKNLIAAVMPSIFASLDFQANVDASSLSNTTLSGSSTSDVFLYFTDYSSTTSVTLGGASASQIEDALSDIDMTSKSSFNITGTSLSEPPPSDLDFASKSTTILSGSSTSP